MTPIAIETLVAFFIPLLVAVLKKSSYPAIYNAAIALVVYVVAGVAAVVVSGQTIDANNLIPTISIFVVAGTAAYQHVVVLLEVTQERVDGRKVQPQRIGQVACPAAVNAGF